MELSIFFVPDSAINSLLLHLVAAFLTNYLLCYAEGIVHLLKKKRENIYAR